MSHPNLTGVVTGDGTLVDDGYTRRRPSRTDQGHEGLTGSGDPVLAYARPPEPQGFRQRPLSEGDVDGLTECKRHHEVVNALMPELATMWAELEQAAEATRDVVDRRNDLDADKAEAEREHAQAVRAAVASGKPAPKAKVRDWDAERQALEVEARARFDHANALRGEYGTAFEAALPDALQRLTAEIGPAREAAQQAWQAAQQPLQRLANVLAVADTVQRRLDPDDLSHRAAPEAERLAKAGPAAVSTVGAWLTSDDELVSGSRFSSPDGIRPSLAVRQALWEHGSHADAARLAVIEFDEGYRYSALTQEEYLLKFVRRVP